MRKVSALLFGLGLAAGVAASAQALPSLAGSQTNIDRAEVTDVRIDGHPHHRCHGMTSGTADAACGTVTGGPSGGLF